MFSQTSGAHFNPVVSFVFFLRRELGENDFIYYVSSQIVAAIIGSAAFLFPEGVRVPFNGTPPLITNCSIVVCVVFKLKANSDNRVGVCISLHTCMNCNRVCLQGQPLS